MAMRRIMGVVLVCLLAGLAVAAFLARGGAADDKVKIGVSVPTADHGWTGGVVWWARKAARDLGEKYPGAEFLVVTADSPAKQIADVEDLVVKGVRALVVLPHEPAPLAPTLNRIRKDGVHLLVVDRTIPELEHDMYLAGDNGGLGRLSGEFLAKEMGGEPRRIVVMTGIPCEVDRLRVEAFDEVMDKHPNITVLERQAAHWSPQKGVELMENFLQKHPRIDAVWCQDDDVLKGVLRAYRESGRQDVSLMLGGAGAKEIVKLILDGDPLVRGTATYHPRMIYDGVVMAAERIIDGKEFPKETILPARLITRENAEEFYYPDSVY